MGTTTSLITASQQQPHRNILDWLRTEYTNSIESACALAAEALKLERTLSDLGIGVGDIS